MEQKASIKPVIQKLGLKTSHRAAFFNVPKEVARAVAPPKGTKVSSKFVTGNIDFVLGFYETVKHCRADLSKIPKALSKTGMAWVCWRKGNVTELSRDLIAALAEKAGLDTVASCAINDDWSALKLMFPKDQRK